jgi:hypothetical protein
MARLIEVADRMHIERLIVFMGSPFSQDPDPAELRRQNDQVLQALSHWHHRAFGFVYLSPAHEQASLDELERCVANGPMVGIKLWKTTGNLPGESTPADLAALAARHPRARLICGHTGGNWELGLRTVRPYPNISVDLGGGDPLSGIAEMAVREVGADRVLYGSDVAGRSFASQLAKVTGALLEEPFKQAILGQNLKRLLTPMLQRKGVRI